MCYNYWLNMGYANASGNVKRSANLLKYKQCKNIEQ